MAVIAEHAMHRLSGRLDAWPLTSWHRSRGGIAHSCPHTVVTAARCLQWGGCVRALGMPGLPTRAVSSALPERPKAEGLWGHRDCMRISAHIWVGARCAWVSCERVYTDPWSRPRRARRARGWLRVSVQVRSRVLYAYTIYLTQTQTARPRDLPVAARSVHTTAYGSSASIQKNEGGVLRLRTLLASAGLATTVLDTAFALHLPTTHCVRAGLGRPQSRGGVNGRHRVRWLM